MLCYVMLCYVMMFAFIVVIRRVNLCSGTPTLNLLLKNVQNPYTFFQNMKNCALVLAGCSFCIEFEKQNAKILICAKLFFFASGRFPDSSRAVDEREISCASQSTQNDLAHLTESARLPTKGCAGIFN